MSGILVHLVEKLSQGNASIAIDVENLEYLLHEEYVLGRHDFLELLESQVVFVFWQMLPTITILKKM